MASVSSQSFRAYRRIRNGRRLLAILLMIS